MANKKCFVIAPIDDEGTPTRKRTDRILNEIIKPITGLFNYETTMPPITKNGIIPIKIIEDLFDADLVIADLTDYNPNVFYELGVRHTINKPTIQIIKEGQAIPFDVRDINTIFLNIKDDGSIKKCKIALRKQIQSIIEKPDSTISFVSYATPKINFLSLQKKLGIVAIHEYSNSENEKFRDKLRNANEIKVIALSAFSIIYNFKNIIVEALKQKNATFKILIAKEKSDTVKEVEILDGSNQGQIRSEIKYTKKKLRAMCVEAEGKGQIWLGQYNTLIRNHIIICDKSWGWLTINYIPKGSVESVALECGPGQLLGDCIIHFDKIWKLSNLRKIKVKQKEKEEFMASIIDIEGIGPEYKKKLATVGIKTTEKLLEMGATPKGKKEIEEKTGIGHKLILEWVNLADLFRIKGVAEEYSDLLEEAGVDTVVELSNRNAENLFEKLNEVNDKKKLVRRPPSLSMVEDWISQAKKLKRVVEY